MRSRSLLLITCLTTALCGSVAYADNPRMAGRQPGAQQTAMPEPDAEKTNDDAHPEKTPTPKSIAEVSTNASKPPAVNTPQPKTGTTMDRRDMENLGPLVNPLKGALGSDMWDGTARSTVQDFLPKLPAGDTLRTAQLLARRVLLSNGDVGQMRNDKSPGPGEDLFTLRLEKLLEMGAYQDAFDLYTLIEGEPSHDRLARDGVMALMEAGYPAQACLEMRAAHKNKSELPDSDSFWTQIAASCLFIQTESVKSLNAVNAKAAPSPVSGVPGSKVLTSLVSQPGYRFNVSSPADIEGLTDVERAVLKGLGRFDYSGMKLTNTGSIAAPVLMTMAGDENMPVATREQLYLEAARRGLIDDGSLGEFYLSVVKKTQRSPSDEPDGSVFGRYAVAAKAETTDTERNSVIVKLLENSDNKHVTALFPFAHMVSAVNPDTLSTKAIGTGIRLMLADGIVPPARWTAAWRRTESGDSGSEREKRAIMLACMVSENLPTESAGFNEESLKPLFSSPESKESIDIYVIFSGLGLEGKLQKYANKAIYEKDVDLTRKYDYVMPVDSLMDKLHDAAKNSRLGETVLLASVALNQYDPAKTHPGVLQEILKDLETVGLREEARALAFNVILSFEHNK